MPVNHRVAPVPTIHTAAREKPSLAGTGIAFHRDYKPVTPLTGHGLIQFSACGQVEK
jgi:hypothetical protein